MTDLSRETLEELKAEFVELGVRLAGIASRRNALHKELAKRTKDAEAQALVSRLTPAQRQVLREELNRDE